MLRIPLNFSKIGYTKKTLSTPTHFTCIYFGGNIYEKMESNKLEHVVGGKEERNDS